MNDWRAPVHDTTSHTEIPLGLLMIPTTLTPAELQKLLLLIRESRPGYFLHLWGHFTECDLETFKEYVDAVTSAGYDFEVLPNDDR